MPRFVVLRVQADPATILDKASGNPIPAVTHRFFPLNDHAGDPILIDAESPESALAVAKRRFPYLAHSLATQEKVSYDLQCADAARRILRRAEAPGA